MASVSAINGVFSHVYIGGARYLCLGAPSFSAPNGQSFLPVAGSASPFLTQYGVLVPVVNMTLLCRDFLATSTEGNPLSATFLGYAQTRTALPNYDVSSFGIAMPGSKPVGPGATDITNAGVAFTDGASIVLMYGTKIANWSISGSKNGVVTLNVTIVGTGFYQYDIATLGDAVNTRITAMMPTTSQCADPLWFPAFNFSETSLANAVISFGINYSNNLDPDPGLNGTYFHNSQNAMGPSGTLALTLQPLSGIPGNHSGASIGTATMVVTNPAASKTCTFAMNKIKSTNPYDRRGSMGRLTRTYNYLLGADCNNLNAAAGDIIVITTSGFGT